MIFDGILVLKLLLLMGAAQLGCSLLARGLGHRLAGRVIGLGFVLPLLLLFPFFDRGVLMVPADPLKDAVPGAPYVPASHRHDLLNDAIYCLLPWELEVRHALSEGRLPLWSDTLEGGSSPWVNPQAQPLSPVAMLTRLLPIQHHLLAALALKILVACEGAWLLARLAGVSRRSSLVAAAGFALSGGLMAWSVFPHSTVAAWAPWMAAGTLVLFRGGGWRAAGTTAAITAILLLSGQPETAAAAGIFAAVAGLSLARRRGFGAAFAKAAVAAILGFCLAAPQLLPFALHLPHTARVHEVVARELPPYLQRIEVPLSWFLPGFGKYMLAPASPRAYGIPFSEAFSGPFNWAESEAGYAGLVAFAGSLAALLACRRRRLWPFLGFALASLVLTAQWIPLALLTHSAGFLKTVAWSRFLLVGCLGFAIAGGFGLDLLFARRRGRLLALAGIAAAAALSLAVRADRFTLGLWLLIAAAAAVAVFAGSPRRRNWAFLAMSLALLLDLVSWARCFLPATHPALFYPRTDFIALVQQEAGAGGGPWRAVGEGRMLFPSLLPVYGVEELRPHNPLTPVQYLRTLGPAFGFAPTTHNYFPAFGGLGHPFLDFLNVRVVTSSLDSPPGAGFERVDGEKFGPFKVYRNNEALPRFFLAAGADQVAEDGIGDYVAAMRDPRRVAVGDRRAVGWTGALPIGQTDAVSSHSAHPGSFALEVAGTGERLLASSLRQPAGWRAGGLETLVINGAFLGVHVPAGVSRIALRYRPPGFAAGLTLGLLGLLAAAYLTARKPGRPFGRLRG